MHIFDKDKISKIGYTDDTAFSSHRIYLEYLVDFLYKKNGNKQLSILECGTGNGSSDYFSKISKEGKAKIWGIEYHNVPPENWYEQMKEKYANENYKITHEQQGIWVFGSEYFHKLDVHYDLIFVDTSGYENRANWVKFAANNTCKVVILHDSEHYHRFKPWLLEWVTKNFKFVYDSWPIQEPGTLFASNIDLECNLKYEGRHNDLPERAEQPEIDPTVHGFPKQCHNEVSKEEQMKRYEDSLKEDDWGHQPC